MIYTISRLSKIEILIQIYIVVFYIILSFSVGYVLIKKLWDNFRYIRFVLLLLIGFIFNLVYGILPDERFILNENSQNILVMTIFVSSLLCIFKYIKQEYDMKFFFTIYRVEISIYLMFILLFIVPYIQIQSLETALKIFFFIPVLVLIIQFFYSVVAGIKKILFVKNNFMRLHILTGVIGILLITVLVILTCLINYKNLILTIFNLTIILFCLDFLMYKKRYSIREENTNIQNSAIDILTNREQEILNIIIGNSEYTYSEISKKLFISEKTLSAHLSKIYKKLEVKGKPELIEKYTTKS